MSRRIGKADVEFYESRMVLLTAHKLTTRDWGTLSHQSRQRLLNKAVDVVHGLLNDDGVQDRMRLFVGK